MYQYLKVLQIITHTHDTREIVFEKPEGYEYKAGQFLTIIMHDRAGAEIRRAYSFCSHPVLDANPAVLVKRITNGEVSRYLTDRLKAGDEVKTLLPTGRFTFTRTDVPRDIFLIAAGSGIGPVYSLLQEMLLTEPQSTIHLLYASHSEPHIIFNGRLQKLVQDYANLNIIHIISDPLEGIFKPTRLNNYMLERIVNDNSIHARSLAAVYMCGPMAFMRTARLTLIFMGFDAAQIRKEDFVIPPPRAGRAEHDTSPHLVDLKYNKKEYSFKVAYPDTILDAALKNGIDLPYNCRGGRCGACIARCVQGSTDMPLNEIITDKEQQEGLILTCITYAQSDIKVEA
jgi:ring-1,2-phenylacetyl-CoA epoxidase subunit PaaE